MPKKIYPIAPPTDNRKPNKNRKLLPEYEFLAHKQKYDILAQNVGYQGNPVHKISPGNFGLTPPCYPESGHMKCDHYGHIHLKEDALALLQEGFEKGMVDQRTREGWPVHVWAVRDGIVFEAKYSLQGLYHGYPAQQDDALAKRIRHLWRLSGGN